MEFRYESLKVREILRFHHAQHPWPESKVPVGTPACETRRLFLTAAGAGAAVPSSHSHQAVDEVSTLSLIHI